MKRRKFLKATTLVPGFGALLASQTSAAKQLVSKREDMPYKELGKTGAKVPILIQGTSQRLNTKYDKVLHRCYKGGVSGFDTALSYGWGNSHKAMKNFIDQVGARKQLWITSKSGAESPKGLKAGLDECLVDMKLDYLDLFLMHGINDSDMLESRMLDAGEDMKASGKTRFFGFSCHGSRVVELMNKAAKTGGIDAILFRYNFRKYGDRELNLAIDACHKAGIGLMAMKTMGSVPKNIESVVRFQSNNFTLGQAKLKSVWADERIDTIVSEMDSVGLARENIAAAKTETVLNALEFQQLNQLAALTANYHCNGCSQICESALNDPIAIADTLRYLMYFESYNKKQRAQELYQSIPVKQRITQLDAAGLQALEQASALCPQGINLAERLKTAQTLLDPGNPVA